jgi:hypothetical protein
MHKRIITRSSQRDQEINDALATIRADLVDRGRLSTPANRLEVDGALNRIRESLGVPAPRARRSRRGASKLRSSRSR